MIVPIEKDGIVLDKDWRLEFLRGTTSLLPADSIEPVITMNADNSVSFKHPVHGDVLIPSDILWILRGRHALYYHPDIADGAGLAVVKQEISTEEE